MEDRVGDILAQRARLERGAGTAIALSLLLHGGMTAAAVWVSIRHPAPAPRTAVSIQFAPGAPASARKNTRVANAAKKSPKAVVEEAQARIEAPAPEVVKKNVTPIEKNTVPTNAFGRSSRRGSETPPPPMTKAATAQTSPGSDVVPPGAVAVADVPVGGTGVTGLEGGDFPYSLYIERMKTLIGSRWFRPQVTPGTTATVSFSIQRDGTIRDWKVEGPSSNSTFDRAALRAIIESSPLPPLPYAYNGTYLGVHLTFK